MAIAKRTPRNIDEHTELTNRQNEQLNRIYVSSVYIQKKLGINRASIPGAIKRGALPKPIHMDGIRTNIFLRDEVDPYIEQWLIVASPLRGGNRSNSKPKANVKKQPVGKKPSPKPVPKKKK